MRVKGDVKTFRTFLRPFPWTVSGRRSFGPGLTEQRNQSAGQSQDTGSPVSAMQDARSLNALTSVSREQVVGGSVQGLSGCLRHSP